MLALDKIPKIFVDEDIHQKSQDIITQSATLLANDTVQSQIPPSPYMVAKSDSAPLSTALTRKNRTRNNSSTSRFMPGEQQQTLFLWNSVSIIDNPYSQSGKTITIDRKSWITKLDDNNVGIPFIYCLDPIGCNCLHFLLS